MSQTEHITIVSVSVRANPDECPDLSWLGTYGNRPESKWAIDRQSRDGFDSFQYRYWNPGPNHIPPGHGWGHVSDRHVVVSLRALPRWQQDLAPVQCGWPARYDRRRCIAFLDRCYIEQDYRRCEAFNRGDWQMLFVDAVAHIKVPGSPVVQRISSGGCGNVESDSDYWKEIGREELASLQHVLQGLGVPEKEAESAVLAAKWPDHV